MSTLKLSQTVLHPGNRFTYLLVTLVAAISCFVSTAVPAQSKTQNIWKSDKPVSIVVPYPPGGSVDLIGRLIAKHLTTVTGQTTVVENYAGADGLIGTRRVIDSQPDGHTLLIQVTGLQLAKYMPGLKGIDPLAQLEPVTNIFESPQVLVTTLHAPQNFKELVEYCRKATLPCSIGISESASRIYAQRLASELALPNLVIASYRGTAPLVTDVMGGQLTMGLVTYPGVISYFQSGRVGISAVFDTERLPQLPQVVSTSEAGFPQLRAVAWFGLFAPKRTPPAQLSAISKAVQLARNDPDFQQRMAGMGAVMVLNTPAEFATTIKSGDETWRALAKRFPLE